MDLRFLAGVLLLHCCSLVNARKKSDWGEDWESLAELRSMTGESLIHLYAETGLMEMVVGLIDEAKVDPNKLTEMGQSPLYKAASAGQKKMMAALIKRGANPDARASGGFTQLHLAVVNKDQRAVKMLLSVGADPNAKDNAGNPPIHYAEQTCQWDLAEILKQSMVATEKAAATSASLLQAAQQRLVASSSSFADRQASSP